MGDSSADKLATLAAKGFISVQDVEKWLAELEGHMGRSLCPTAATVDGWADTIKLTRRCLLAMPNFNGFTEAA